MTPIDYALIALWSLILVVNRAASLPLFVLLLDLLCFEVLEHDFYRYCITASAYFIAAQSNFRMISTLRHVFMCAGAVCFIGAVDDAIYIQFKYSTAYYSFMPYFVVMFNALIAALLLKDGGRNIDGITGTLRHLVNRARLGLQLLYKSKGNHKAGT